LEPDPVVHSERRGSGFIQRDFLRNFAIGAAGSGLPEHMTAQPAHTTVEGTDLRRGAPARSVAAELLAQVELLDLA
jgi:hypothetical protein